MNFGNHTDDEAVNFKWTDEERSKHYGRMSVKQAVGKANNIRKQASLFMAQKKNLMGLKQLSNQIDSKLDLGPQNASEFRKEAIKANKQEKQQQLQMEMQNSNNRRQADIENWLEMTNANATALSGVQKVN